MGHLTGRRQGRWTGYLGRESKDGAEPRLVDGGALRCHGEKSSGRGCGVGGGDDQGFGVWTC